MEYQYVIFEDKDRQTFILRSCLVKNSIFAKSIGKLTEVERGIISRPESEKDNTLFFIGELINKEKEYLLKRAYKK